jgi:hypothetical protein
MNTLLENINSILGLHVSAQDLTFVQISLCGVIVFVTALLMVHFGDKRFFVKQSGV